MMTYSYALSGTNRDGQTWTARGRVEIEGDKGDLMVAMERCLSDAFLRLTKGEAVYGQPGVACRGPYRVTGFELKVGEGSDVD